LNSAESNFNYDEIILIVDDEEPVEGVDENNDEIAPIESFYALALITGLSVTEEGKEHLIIPGSFIDNDFTDNVDFTRNFIVSTQPGLLTVSPATLEPTIVLSQPDGSASPGVISYGDDLPVISTQFNAFKYNDDEQNVFDTIVYYLDDLGTTEVERLENYQDIGAYRLLADYQFYEGDPVNYLLSQQNEPVITVNAAPVDITFDESTLSQVFGNTDDVIIITTALGEQTTIPVIKTYNGSTDFPSDAGTYEVVVTSADPKFTGTATGTLVIDPAPAQIQLSNLVRVFDGQPHEIGISVSAHGEELDLNVVVTYDGSQDLPVNAGEYLVSAYLDENNYEGTSNDTLRIMKAQAAITFNPYEATYNGQEQPVTVSAEALDVVQDVDFSITYLQNGQPADPINAGIYEVIATIDDQNIEGTDNTQIVVDRAELTLVADDQITNQGQLPDFTSSISGFVNNETYSDVFDQVQVHYTLDVIDIPGFYPGAINPSITEPLNYVVSTAKGNLYVNPFGPGTKKIQVYLACVETTDDPNMPFIANFEYRNRNDHSIYIPFTGDKPSDNYLEANGSFELITGDVFDFQPGSGLFNVKFDGNRLIWIVKSWSSEESSQLKKTAVASEASSSSSRCPNSVESQIIGYPNPVQYTFNIKLEGVTVDSEDISILDQYGQAYQVKMLENPNIQGIELDMELFPSGYYIIRIANSQLDETFIVLKE
jgi:hypothetical protein